MKGLRTIISLLLLMFLCGCRQEPLSVPLSQPADQILSIELMEDQRDASDQQANHVVICQIPSEHYEEFITDLQALPASKNSLNPPTEFGWWIIRITYKNGGMDMIGPDNNASFKDEKWIYGSYGFSWEDFQAFFGNYVYQIVPDYVPKWH